MPGSRQQCGLTALALSAALLAGGAAAQPLDDGYHVRKQPPGECAATSTWLMLVHYYGAPGETGAARLPNLCAGSSPQDCRDERRTVSNANELEQWISLLKGDTLQPSLRSLGRSLERMRDPATGAVRFDTVGDFKAAKRRGSGTTERERRLEQIRRLLDQDRPVILHMGRPFPYAGHYLTLVGYEADADIRYAYVDTSYPERGVSWVSQEDLIGKRWYDPGSAWIPAAVWNGRFLSFWPRNS